MVLPDGKCKREDDMETKDVIVNLRTKNNMTQEDLAERVYVTR